MTYEWSLGSVDGAGGPTERAPGAQEVDGAPLRQQVSDSRGGSHTGATDMAGEGFRASSHTSGVA